MSKLEKDFQKNLIKELEAMFPGSIVVKNETYIQGFPDLTIYYGKKWACLECKKESDSKRQPNQPFYVDRMNSMSFARFIYPENKNEVLQELQVAFSN